jgi:CheY-like chemotaxis protein
MPDNPQMDVELTLVAARGPLTNISVLVVDDDEAAREVLSAVLTAEGAAVTTAATSEAAFEQVDSARPDVMLVDIAMPGVDGFTFVEHLRRRPPAAGGDIPVAALTGYISSHDRAHASRVGFQAYLTKPVDPGELVRTIKELAASQGRTAIAPSPSTSSDRDQVRAL